MNHWENDSLSRWDLSLDLNAVTLDSPDMAGGRELSRVGARKEKDISPLVDWRPRRTEREEVLEYLRGREGTWEERREERYFGARGGESNGSGKQGRRT